MGKIAQVNKHTQCDSNSPQNISRPGTTKRHNGVP